MRAVQLVETIGPAGVRLVEVDEPRPGPGQVLIDVHVAGLTFPDLLMSHAAYQRSKPLPFVLGGEVSGVVRSAPDGATVRAGQRVAAILPNFGGFAEAVAVPHEHVFPLPDEVGFDVAACVPVNYLTMQFAYKRRTVLQPGESVLVHGAAGGVGVAAIQLARAWGAQVLAVASSADKQRVAQEAGAHHVLPVEGFRDAARSLVPDGVDVVVDPVGGDRLVDSVRALADEGRVLIVGFAGGSIPSLRVNRLLLHNQSLIGINLGISPDGVSVQLDSRLSTGWQELMPLLADGSVRPAIGMRLPLERAGDALAAMAGRSVVGKVLLRVR